MHYLVSRSHKNLSFILFHKGLDLPLQVTKNIGGISTGFPQALGAKILRLETAVSLKSPRLAESIARSCTCLLGSKGHLWQIWKVFSPYTKRGRDMLKNIFLPYSHGQHVILGMNTLLSVGGCVSIRRSFAPFPVPKTGLCLCDISG